jgi:hypothetical protein
MFQKKIITREDGTPYLIRTYLIKCKLFQIVLHKILLSDNDCLHDHQWNFLSIILKGGYWECTDPEQVLSGPELEWFKEKYPNQKYCRWFGAGNILFRFAEWKHSLTLDTNRVAKEFWKEKPCTTLVIMFRKKREWGFWTKQGWLHWTKYRSTQKCD